MNPLITSDLDLTAAEPEPDFDEKQDVANITPDSSIDEKEPVILATDHDAIKSKFMPELPDLDILDEATHTWNIRDWSKLGKREHGPTFNCGGSPWRILFFPFGNQPDFASFYLEHGYEDKPAEDWYACVQFLLVLSNPNEPSIYVHHNATHRFNAEEGDWGFTRFCELRRLMSGKFNDEGRHLIEDDAATVTAYVRVIKDPTGVLWHSFINYDSKKETGMVGLKNQGATCYLNSLLQSLYFTNTFRQAVYQIPTENEINVKENSAYALQRLFYLLQTTDAAVSTNELTTSFGWESRQIFEQQDVQELSRILMEKLEDRMKGTPAEKALPNLFVGRRQSKIECINVDYVSKSAPEFFWDVQLNVRGNTTLDDSFKDDIKVEMMDGENQYHAEGYGLQDAKRQTIFESFPPVLHLQLKRFEYDFQTDSLTKIYDRYEFPEVWDASPYLSEEADKSEPYIYHLHGVLVHSGDLNAGHYYAFLKPSKNGGWYKFDDDRVTRATKKEAMDENFGGDFVTLPNGQPGQRNPYTRTWSKQRFMSAYMLVYLRESRHDEVLHPIGPADIPPHLERNILEERAEAERRRKEREEAHLYMQVLVGTNDNFNAHQGFDLFPKNALTAMDGSIPKVYRQLRSTTMRAFNLMIAEELGLDEDLIRPWVLVNRQNATVRPDQPIEFPEATIEEVCTKLQAKLPFRLWIETTKRNAEGQPDMMDYEKIINAKDPAKPILIFLKHFDATSQTLRGQGHLYIGKQQKIADLGPLILERMDWPAGVNLRLYEEIKDTLIEPLATKQTFAGSDLQDGDIICFQKVLPDEEQTALQEAGKYTDPQKFYDYLLNRVSINFNERNDPDNEDKHFTLELNKRMAYDQLVAKIADHLKADSTHIRLSTVTASTFKARAVVKKTTNTTLHTILFPQSQFNYTISSNQRNDWLFYEVLELSLSELETKKPLRITLLSDGITKEEPFDVLVPKNGMVRDIMFALQKKAKISDEVLPDLRLIEVHGHRIFKELPEDQPVSSFNEFVSLYAELIPQEELEADQGHDTAVYAYHFDKEANKSHGVPFKFVVRPGEPFKETKERISKRTGIKGKLLEKVKFAVISKTAFAKPEYLEDDDILSDRLISSEDLLGLDHFNKSRNIMSRNDAMSIK